MKKTKGMGILANATHVAGKPVTGYESAEENARAWSDHCAKLESENADFVTFLEKLVAEGEAWLLFRGWKDGRWKKNKNGSYRRIGDLPSRADERMDCETFAVIQEAQQVIGFAKRCPKEIPAIRATFEAGRAWGAVFAYDQVGRKEVRTSGYYLDQLARELERREAAGEPRPPRDHWGSIVDILRRRDGLEEMKGPAFRKALEAARKRIGNSILIEA